MVKDPSLRAVSKPVQSVDKKITLLIKDLKDTLVVQKDPEGIGLAAPQIGKNLRLFIMTEGKKLKTIINPEILSFSSIKAEKKEVKSKTKKSMEKKIMEGCLSLPHYYGPLERTKLIKLKYLDEKGKERIETFEGLPAQIVQHEIDHLNGILFIDRLLEQKAQLFEFKGGEWEEVEI